MEINREYRSSVFAMLFNDRKELLTLYNAINGTAYTEEDRVISELPFYGSSFCSHFSTGVAEEVLDQYRKRSLHFF